MSKTRVPDEEHDPTEPPRRREKEREGDCDFCGRWDSRLLEGVCKWCREHWKL